MSGLGVSSGVGAPVLSVWGQGPRVSVQWWGSRVRGPGSQVQGRCSGSAPGLGSVLGVVFSGSAPGLGSAPGSEA